MAKPTAASRDATLLILKWMNVNPGAVRLLFGDPKRGLEASNGVPPHGDGPKDFGLHGICDAEHGMPADVKNECHYSAGHAHGARVVMFQGAAVHLVSHKIPAVTKDIGAAEAWEVAALTGDIITIATTLIELGVPIDYAVPIWTDSTTAIFLAQDARALKRVAYVARRIRFIQEAEALDYIKCMHIAGVINPVDALTKYVTARAFFIAMSYITGVAHDPDPPIAGEAAAPGVDTTSPLDFSSVLVQEYVSRDMWGANALAEAERLEREGAAGCEVAGSSMARVSVLRRLASLKSAPPGNVLSVRGTSKTVGVLATTAVKKKIKKKTTFGDCVIFELPPYTIEERALDATQRARLAASKKECAALGGRHAAVASAYAECGEVNCVTGVEHPEVPAVGLAPAMHSHVHVHGSRSDLYLPVFLGRGGTYDYDSDSSEDSVLSDLE